MLFDPQNKKTWPADCEDVQIHSSIFGFTHGQFHSDDENETGFGNWFDRMGDDEDADFALVLGEINWWRLPGVQKQRPNLKVIVCFFIGHWWTAWDGLTWVNMRYCARCMKTEDRYVTKGPGVSS